MVELERSVEAGDTLEIRYIPGEEAAPDVPKRWPMVPCPVTAAAGARIAVHCKRKVSSAAWCTSCAARRARPPDAAVATVLDGVQDAAPPAPDARAEGIRALLRFRSSAPGRGCRVHARMRTACPRRHGASSTTPSSAQRALAWRSAGAEVFVPAFAVAEMGCRGMGIVAGPLDGAARRGLAHRRRGAFQRSLCTTAGAVACRNLTQVAYARDAGSAFEIASPIHRDQRREPACLRGPRAPAACGCPTRSLSIGWPAIGVERLPGGSSSKRGFLQASGAHGDRALPSYRRGRVLGLVRRVRAPTLGALSGRARRGPACPCASTCAAVRGSTTPSRSIAPVMWRCWLRPGCRASSRRTRAPAPGRRGFPYRRRTTGRPFIAPAAEVWC